MGLFNWKSKKKEDKVISTIKDAEVTLILLTDRKKYNLREFFFKNGIHIDEVLYDIEDAKISMMLASNKCRLVIAETGLSKFTSTVNRREISDILGIGDGIDKFVTVFYTDSIIKAENTEGRRNRDVDWRVYKSTTDIVEVLKSYNENYVSDRELEPEQVETYDTVMQFTGKEVEINRSADEVKVLEFDGAENRALEYFKESGMESLEVYNVAY